MFGSDTGRTWRHGGRGSAKLNNLKKRGQKLKHTWRSLNDVLSSKTEEEVKAMIDEEKVGRKRISHLLRLHQRYCALRDARERMELLKEVTA